MTLEWVTKLGEFADHHIYEIRSLISCTVFAGSLYLCYNSRHGQRVAIDSKLLPYLCEFQSKIYGRFLINDSIYFYHEPMFLRLIGRTHMDSIQLRNCLKVKLDPSIDLNRLQSYNGKFGKLKLLNRNEDSVQGIPFIRTVILVH